MMTRKLWFIGLLLALLLPTLGFAGDVCTSITGNLVTNCGFETGDFTGWTLLGSPAENGVTSVFSTPYSGSFEAYFGATLTDGFLSQTLSTTPGATYTISWFLASDGSTPNDFSAAWNGTTLFSQTNLPAFGFTNYTYTAVASSNATLLQFGFRNDPGFLTLDSVSVVDPVVPSGAPEPGTLIMLGAGIAGIALLRKRRA